jgi:hypothetical protein
MLFNETISRAAASSFANNLVLSACPHLAPFVRSSLCQPNSQFMPYILHSLNLGNIIYNFIPACSFSDILIKDFLCAKS